MDNASLTPEQVATIILDSLDRDVMPGLGVIDENFVVASIYLDLTSVNRALSTVYDLLDGSLPGTAGGDVKTIAGERDRPAFSKLCFFILLLMQQLLKLMLLTTQWIMLL